MPRRSPWSFTQARITRGALTLLVALAVASLGFLLAPTSTQASLAEVLIATPDSIWHRFSLWQLVTSPLIQPDFIKLLFEGFLLFMFLPALERWWGKKRFLLFALYTSVAGVLVGTGVGALLGGVHGVTPVSGLEPFIFASILAFGVLYANQPVQFFGVLPMTGKQMAIGITAFTAVFIVIGQKWVEGAAQGSAMLLALLMTSSRSSPKLYWLKWKQRRMRSKFSVVDGGRRKRDEKRWLN
jgi:membrane associated rhomboid family serine protease